MHHCLLYTAKCYKPFDRNTLGHILRTSRVRNEMSGITGILLYGRCAVMQLLEGPQPAVEKTLARIEADPLVHDIRIHVSRSCETRLFPGWSMAYDCRGDAERIVDAADLRNPDALPGSGGRFSLVLTMLKNFRDDVALMDAPPSPPPQPAAGLPAV